MPRFASARTRPKADGPSWAGTPLALFRRWARRSRCSGPAIGDAQAAALPLTAITAWEMLFDRLGIERGGDGNHSLLIVGAAGGVGSIMVQLARRLTRLTVIGTASRPETTEWVRSLGAHRVVDHARPIAEEL